jgi:OHCU decarboxylase
MNTGKYPRDLVGYGRQPPHADWPGGARIALQFVLNYEEGAENCVLHGDAGSETFLSEIVGGTPYVGARHMSMESLYEYGSRAGVWRILRLFRERKLPLTIFAVAMALERNPEAAAAFVEGGHEIASHGWRWINYHGMAEAEERSHIARAVETIERMAGARPLGWYTGRTSENTRRLVAEFGGFLYDSDAYSDDLPYWEEVAGKAQLIVPYALDTNDMRFATVQGFNTGEQFFAYLRDAFDTLYAEGAESPKMLSVGLHCRLIGRPGRLASLARFLDHVEQHERVWICRRVEIARHWMLRHPLSEKDFVAHFGAVYEHSPWVAARAFRSGPFVSIDLLAAAMQEAVLAASLDEQLALIRAHPELLGRLEAAELTVSSRAEQASAGLERCTAEEKSRMLALNRDYRDKFGFPFVVAVKGLDWHGIIERMEARLPNSREAEIDEALRQIGRIARLRLESLRS